MSDNPLDADGQSEIVKQLIAEHRTRTDAGEPFPFEKFIAAHPEHTDELTRYFKQWNELEAPPQPDQAGADESKTGTSAPGKLSFEDATAHTMVQVSGDSESSLTQAYDQSGNASATSVEISESFGRYAIQKVLGQGAMGAVYLAKDTQLDRDVALKIPKFGDGNGVDEEELLARFYREARAAATLRSPNICPVYDVGEIDGQHYITMAFIEGRPLKDYTKSKKTHSEKQIITTIRKLALGLSEAHEIGVIHRDLKPANIMVDLKGEPVVMDFGLARRSSSDDVQVTQSGAIIGTPAYMAPEQVAGDQTAIDHQADIYALGVIMYELITGEMPFKGNLMSLLQQIALNNPTKPSELRPDIDPRLEAICLKMIAGDREQRYQSMTDVANDLQEVLRNPDEKHKQAQAKNKKKDPKPKSLPTAKEESNPALISIDRTESSVVRMRAKLGKKSLSKGKSTAASKSKSSGPSKKLLIAGGIGGLLLLLGIAYFVRDGKQDVQITQDDPGITNHVDGKTALAAKVVNGQLDGELPDSHSESEPIKNPPPAASNSQRYALSFPEPTSVVEVNAPFRLDEDFTLEAWVTVGDVPPKANEEDPPNQSILDLSSKIILNLHRMQEYKWSFTTTTQFIPGYEYVVYRGRYSNEDLAIRGDRNHIAAVFENGEIRHYVDGKRLDIPNYGPERDPAQGKPPTMVRELTIGNCDMGHCGPFRGLIEGVRYSKGARYKEDFMPPAELTNDSNTEALYLFKEGQGDILKDYSGNGYDGKIVDAKWVKVGEEPIVSSPPPAPTKGSSASVVELLTSDEYEWTEPVNMGPNVNSEKNDVYPTLSADGLSLIFTSARVKNENLFMCRRASVNDAWGPAEALVGTYISQHDQISPWLSTDGLMLLFGNKPVDSDNVNIFQTRRATRDAPWDTPIDLGSPLNSDKVDGGGALTPDGLTMYLSSKRPGAQFRDLYRARRAALDAPWQEPMLLGREINLAGEEKSPQLLADGKSLMYISCDGRKCQLMLAQPVADGSFHVQALESPIGRIFGKISFCLSTDGQTLIFDSRRAAGLGGLDLWMSRRVKKSIDMEKSVKVDHDSTQTIDLLSDLVPTTLNSEDMSWQMQDGILAGSSSPSREKKEWVGAIFPQEISGDFDIELELKQSGFAPLQIDLPLGDKQAIRLHLGGLGCALMQIDGKADRDAAPQYRNEDTRMKRNVWQRLTAKVRHQGENVSIDVALDGERIGLFSGPRSRITLPKWVKPDPVHVKFAGTGVSGILELEFRRALVHINPPAVMQIEKTSPK